MADKKRLLDQLPEEVRDQLREEVKQELGHGTPTPAQVRADIKAWSEAEQAKQAKFNR